VLMTAGVGLFGTLSGIVASWFLAPQKGDEQEQVAELRVAVTELREAVDRLRRAQETSLSDPQDPSKRSDQDK
jgi:voltage-gated potassium channel